MRLVAVRAIRAAVAAFAGMAMVAPPAQAVKPFYDELEAKYVKPRSEEPNDLALRFAIEQAGCTICHPGDNKQRLTRYGSLVGWRVNKFDQANKKKIRAAFDEVGKLRSDPHDPKSPTYAELFRQGRLPPGPVDY
jgi:hypothetical protein